MRPERASVIVHRGAAEWARCERELCEAGMNLPLACRAAAGGARPWAGSWFVEVRADGRCRGGIAVQQRPLRAVPGHNVLRVERFGATLLDDDLELAADALVDLVRGDPRNLRLNADIHSRDPDTRARIARVLAERGFTRADPPNVYVETLVMDLAPSEEALFAALHRSARRNVREAEKAGLELRTIDDPALVDRMDALLEETMARTGGRYLPQDWAGRMKLAREHPELARLVGTFQKHDTGPDTLLAFAFGCAHGDHGQYSDAASTRNTEVRVSLAYPLLWDIILWAKRNGMSWFDLGGVTRGNLGDDADPLGGISDFKRYFTRDLAAIGDDWVLESSTMRARIARAVHRRLQKA